MTPATLDAYPGATHRITDTYKEQLNEDLLAFVQGAAERATVFRDRRDGLMPISHTARVTLNAPSDEVDLEAWLFGLSDLDS